MVKQSNFKHFMRKERSSIIRNLPNYVCCFIIIGSKSFSLVKQTLKF